jgi:glycosyltransferase 2 family protein
MRTEPLAAPGAPAGASRRRAWLLRMVPGLLLTGLIGGWAFRDTRWAELWASLLAANFLWLVPHVALLQVVHMLRAWRWGSLLSGMERVPFRHLNEATAVGNMLFVLLPLRLGEFARPILISRRSSIRASAALTSVVLERIIDGVAIALLLEGTLAWVGEDSATLRYLRWVSHLMLGGFLGLWGLLLLAYWQRALAVGLVRRGVGWLSPSLAERVAGLMDSFVGAVRQVSGPRQFLSTVLLTAAIWAVNALALVALARAFGCEGAAGGCAPLSLSTFQGLVVLGVTVLGSMIPAAPGMAGTFQAGVKVSLSLFFSEAVVNGTGLAFANVLWLATLLHQVALGAAMLMLGAVRLEGLVAGRGPAAES